MEYYLLKSNSVRNPEPARLSHEEFPYLMNEENFMIAQDKFVDYYMLFPETELPELLTQPTFLCRDGLKRIMELYDPYIEWKSLYLLPSEDEQMTTGTLHYWLPAMTKQNCLHDECVILPNGAVQELILDKRKIRNMDVFQVGGTQENIVVVSLALAESISRRHLYGVKLCKVEVR